MLDLMRAWDLAQEDLLLFDPEDSLSSAAQKLLQRRENGVPTPCGIVQDANGRFLGTLSTHRVLRAIGKAIDDVGAFKPSAEVDMERAVHAACHLVGGEPVKKHMYTKAMEVSPRTTLPELLHRFAATTAHFAVVTEAGRALGLLDLDDIFKNFALEMKRPNPVNL